MKYLELVKRNIRRTPYQAMAASLVMFFTFLTLLFFIIMAVGSQRILQYFESRPQAIAFFKDNTNASDITAIENALKQTGRVTKIKFVSKDEALQIYRSRNNNDPRYTDLVTANILPASIEISAVSPTDLIPIAEVLKKEPVVEDVVIPQDVIQAITNSTIIVRTIGLAAVTFLIFFSFLVILMVIGFKIRLKRNEIEIMKLLGASNWFIRAPFILEGIIYGLVGGISAWLVSYGLIWYFTPQLKFYLQGIPPDIVSVPPPISVALLLLLFAIITALIIGGLGSYGAVRRYLKL